LREFSNSEPKHIELKQFEKGVPDDIANLVLFLYGLACYRAAISDPQPRYWDRAIEILSSVDSKEASFYSGLCWQERAKQVREAKEAKDNLAKAISAFRKILGDNPAEWKISEQSEELTYAAYYNGANALAELALLSPPQYASDFLGLVRELYETAVAVRTREKFPVEWAFAQNNLGNVLVELGTRLNDGSQHLQSAVDAYTQALQVYAQQDKQREYPTEWATTENNLGNALLYLGSRENGANQKLTDAVTAYNQAMGLYKQRGSNQDWAMATSNRGYALTVLGSREDGANEDLQNAVKACEKALEIRTREKMPQDWAYTQNNLAYSLRELGNRLDGEAGIRMLRRSVDSSMAALGVYNETDSMNWAMTKDNLGRSLCDLGLRLGGEDGKKLVKNSCAAHLEAATVNTREYLPQKWAYTQSNIGKALVALSRLEGGDSHLQEAIVILRDVQSFYRGNYPAQYDEITALLETLPH
jgi:tetratricopeptide (TPR) repeat protein